MTERIIEALKKLDAQNPGHWTASGTPNMNIVNIFAGDGEKIAVKDVEAVAPGFSKQNAATYFDQNKGEDNAGTQVDTSQADAAQAEGQSETQQATQIQDAGNVVTQQQTTDEQGQPDPLPGIDAAIEHTRKQLDELNASLSNLLRQRDDIVTARERERKGQEDPNLLYLRAQQARLSERAAHVKNLRQAGITAKTLSDILPQAAPVDKMLQTRRGNRRG